MSQRAGGVFHGVVKERCHLLVRTSAVRPRDRRSAAHVVDVRLPALVDLLPVKRCREFVGSLDAVDRTREVRVRVRPLFEQPSGRSSTDANGTNRSTVSA